MVEPSAERYARYTEIVGEIDRKLAKIREDTGLHSSHKPTLDHPDFNALVEQGDKIVPYLFHVMTHRGASWVIILLLHKLVPDVNPIKAEHRGNFYAIIHDWLGWYLNSLYWERDDIYHGLVD